MVRDLVSEVVGMSPYERRLLDMLKTGGVGAEKRMYKFAKRRVSPCFTYGIHLINWYLICNIISSLLLSWEPTEERSRRETRSRRPMARSELALLPTKSAVRPTPPVVHLLLIVAC